MPQVKYFEAYSVSNEREGKTIKIFNKRFQ